ncbi:hypothetical protein M0R72_21890 [Candidatus Pacearchaeota archaeon]|nr:hypothetical protein [Candidatus Pacearchaeota archaeon]
MKFISLWKRLRNLEIAFAVHENRLNETDERLDELEETRDGKSCIGFIEDNDEPLVGM